MCSDAPDPDPMIGQAAMANADIAREAMQYYRERDAAQAPRQAQMDDLTAKLANEQLSSSQFNDAAAREQMDRYRAYGIPAEDAMYADAANYDSQDQLDKAAGQASTDVAATMGKARDATMRSLARSGVNPADGRSIASEQEMDANTALAEASAMNGARDNRRQMGVMLRKDAASFGRGATGTAAQTFGTSMAAGGAGTGAVGAAIGAANATTQTMGSGFSTAVGANQSAGTMMNNLFDSQSKAASSGAGGMMSGIGGLASGLGAMGVKASMFSDENMKENRQPVDPDAALEGIANTDVEQWTYKPGTEADDGGQQHIGAMAQQMKKTLGPTVSDGHKVDIISAIGVNMAATKALANKVDQLAEQVASTNTGAPAAPPPPKRPSMAGKGVMA